MKSYLFAACAAVVSLSASAFAAPLNLVPTYPDVFADNLQINYVLGAGSSGTLTVTGFTQAVSTSNVTLAPALGSFNLTLNVTHGANASDPVTVTGGSLLITGNFDGVGGAETLFSSTHPLAFGYSAEDKFEFIWQQDVASALAPLNGQIGIIVGGGNTIGAFSTPAFNTAFSNNGLAVGDAFVVPEPATLSAAAVGMAALLVRRRKA